MPRSPRTGDRVTQTTSQPIPTIGVGMLGYAFMGKAHSNALRTIPYMTWPPPLMPRLVSIAGRDEPAVSEAAIRYGFDRYATDWRELVADPDVQLFDNAGPNGLHAEPTIVAAEAGKHVICEKPLGRTADESFEMWSRVQASGVKHMCAFNYRFVPAVRLARDMIAAGELGEIYHFRGQYLQDWIADPEFPHVWRMAREASGSGALGDLGAHVIDLARYLVGEVEAVTGATRTFVPERPGGSVDVDDAFSSTIEFASGGIGTIDASRFCVGRKNALTWEVNGSKGSIAFNLERINELQVNLAATMPGARAQGSRQVLVTAPDHPFLEHWWPEGHVLGWEHTFVHEFHHLLRCIAEDAPISPHGATFEDGYRVAEVCEAILRASEQGQRQELSYREAAGSSTAVVSGTPAYGAEDR
jgi:predicted dehydrogenase